MTMAKLHPIRKYSYTHYDMVSLMASFPYWQESPIKNPDWVFRGQALCIAIYNKAVTPEVRELARKTYYELQGALDDLK